MERFDRKDTSFDISLSLDSISFEINESESILTGLASDLLAFTWIDSL